MVMEGKAVPVLSKQQALTLRLPMSYIYIYNNNNNNIY